MTCLALSRQIIQRKRYCWLFHFCSIFVCRLCVCVYSSVCVCVCVCMCVCLRAIRIPMRWEMSMLAVGSSWWRGQTWGESLHWCDRQGWLLSWLSWSVASRSPSLLLCLLLCHFIVLFVIPFSFQSFYFPLCHIILLIVISSSSLLYHSLFRPFIFLFVISFSSLSFRSPLCYFILCLFSLLFVI